jgi:hypothetical protein
MPPSVRTKGPGRFCLLAVPAIIADYVAAKVADRNADERPGEVGEHIGSPP